MKYIITLTLVLLSACSLLGENQWSAYKLTVNVQNELGQSIENVKLESSEMKTQMSNEIGRTTLQFRNAGLHVVTISANDRITKQIKISLPTDDNKIFNVVLIHNP